MIKQTEKRKPLESIKNYSSVLGTEFPETSIQTHSERTHTKHSQEQKSLLVRRDLLSYERILCDDFSHFLKFDGHALYFPTQDELQTAQYIEKEKKLLLPLRRNNALLGVLLLRNVRVQKSLLPFLTNLASICLDKIYFLKTSRLDERCQLTRLPYFMNRVYKEVCNIKKYYAQSIAKSYAQTASGFHPLSHNYHDLNVSSDIDETSAPNSFNSSESHTIYDFDQTHPTLHASHNERQTSLGLMVLPVLGLTYIKKYFGYNIAEQIFIKLSQEIKTMLPEDTLCTMLDEEHFAVFYSGATKKMMDTLAKECANISAHMHAMPLPTMFANLEHLMGENFHLPDIFDAISEQATLEINDIKTTNTDENNNLYAQNPYKENTTFESTYTQSQSKHGIRITLKVCAGYSIFPQDWDGTLHSQERAEIPHILLNKARIAANRLKNKPHKKGISPEQEEFHIAGQHLSFTQILTQSGSIEEILPYSQVRVNLGNQDGALENMCFSVWADVNCTSYKGEILLQQVSEHNAIAQILILSDPAKSIEEGDFLQYIPESHSQSEALGDENTLFYAYQDFMHAVTENISTQRVKNFSISLLRIQWDMLKDTHITAKNTKSKTKKKEKQNITTNHEEANHFTLKDVAKQLYRYIKAYNEKNSPLMAHDELNNHTPFTAPHTLAPLVGSMSYNSILIYHPYMDKDNAHILYEKIANMIQKNFAVPCAIGVAIYPYLSLRPADMWESCRKALDYAMLLPDPHVGIFDSLAINISADRKFSQGDTFGALEEYRTALLADGDNILAWNSLGVCLAELGRHAEARNAFEVAYARNSKDAATCYNLGSANFSLGDREKAKEYFLVCLSQESKHLYARIRLGEIAEKEKVYDDAYEQYQLAAHTNPESSVPLRGLARLAIQQNQKERARELLQLALQKNSDDAVSLQLLAGLYLDGGEDAHLAEVLARQSVALLPWRRSAWSELARALEAQEKFSEAAQVRRNSMRL